MAIRNRPSRTAFEASFAGRFWLRFHMAIMLLTAASAGFLTNIALLQWPVHDVLVRWCVGFVVGYLVLFGCMRIWLAYVGVRPLEYDGGDILDAGNWSGGSSGSSGTPMPEGGGSFGGGGASGPWSDGGSSSLFQGGGHASSGGSGGWSLPDVGGGIDLDEGTAVVILVVIVLALATALGGGVIYLIVSAPHLLVDVAFGAALAGGMAPSAHRAAQRGPWAGGVLAATWKPFLALLVVLVLAALAFRHYFPGALTLGEAWRFYR